MLNAPPRRTGARDQSYYAPQTPAQRRRAQGIGVGIESYASEPNAPVEISLYDLYREYDLQLREYDRQGHRDWMLSEEFPWEEYRPLREAAFKEAERVIGSKYKFVPSPFPAPPRDQVIYWASELAAIGLMYQRHPFGSQFNHHFNPIDSEKG